MDEVLMPGWKQELSDALELGATRPRYKYTWSWKDDARTVPDLQYGGDKIHTRKGYRWKHPVHEVMSTYGGHREIQHWTNLEIHHYPDNSKPRSQYLPLLKQAVEESPYDDRNAFYYARELYFYSQYDDAAKEFKRHLALPSAVWAPERAASMRYLAKIEYQNRAEWLLKSIAEAPGRREAIVDLAKHYYDSSDWEGCYKYALEATLIKERPLEYLCEDFAWGELPWDLAAYSSYMLGRPEEALKYNEIAISLNQTDKRLRVNSLHYQQAIKDKN
jgi:tetratricopeptide (TPR) repeat protein